MPDICCAIPEGIYVAEDVDAGIAAAPLIVHNNVHIDNTTVVGSPAGGRKKTPKILQRRYRLPSSMGIVQTWNRPDTR